MNLPSLSLTMLDGTHHNFTTFLKNKCAINSTEHSFVVGMKVAYFENQLIITKMLQSRSPLGCVIKSMETLSHGLVGIGRVREAQQLLLSQPYLVGK